MLTPKARANVLAQAFRFAPNDPFSQQLCLSSSAKLASDISFRDLDQSQQNALIWIGAVGLESNP